MTGVLTRVWGLKINDTGGTLLFASLLPVVPFEQEGKLVGQQIHLAIFEILGEKSAFISHIQNENRILFRHFAKGILSLLKPAEY